MYKIRKIELCTENRNNGTNSSLPRLHRYVIVSNVYWYSHGKNNGIKYILYEVKGEKVQD